MKQIESKRISINSDIKFRGKPIEVADKSYQIKKAWKKFFKIFFILIILAAFIVSIFMFGRYTYYKEYYSKTWYLETAYLDNSHAYLVTTYEGDVKKEITKYTRFYTYTGKDGNIYFHQLKNNDTEGIIGEELKIYVDEKNNAKTLTYNDFKDENILMYGLIAALFIPYIILSFIKLITLYIKKHKLNREAKKKEKNKDN